MTAEILREVNEKTNSTSRGFVAFDTLIVPVRIIDSRKVYGRIDVLVTPIGGSGEKWIDLARVKANV